MPKTVAVQQRTGAEVATEVMAEAIVAISSGIKRLRAGKLNDKALYLLIQHSAPTTASGQRIPISTITDVIEGLDSLSETYLRKPAGARH
jgi:hypothetical protein